MRVLDAYVSSQRHDDFPRRASGNGGIINARKAQRLSKCLINDIAMVWPARVKVALHLFRMFVSTKFMAVRSSPQFLHLRKIYISIPFYANISRDEQRPCLKIEPKLFFSQFSWSNSINHKFSNTLRRIKCWDFVFEWFFIGSNWPHTIRIYLKQRL